MVPARLVSLDKLPLTPNGKIDRKALPEPTGEVEAGREYVAPRKTLETRLALIWQQVLGIARVGVHDNFFDLGGHSLRASTLVSKIERATSQGSAAGRFPLHHDRTAGPKNQRFKAAGERMRSQRRQRPSTIRFHPSKSVCTSCASLTGPSAATICRRRFFSKASLTDARRARVPGADSAP